MKRINSAKILFFASLLSSVLNIFYFTFLVFVIYPITLEAYTRIGQQGFVKAFVPVYIQTYTFIISFSLGVFLLSLHYLHHQKKGKISLIFIWIGIVISMLLILRVIPYYRDIPQVLGTVINNFSK